MSGFNGAVEGGVLHGYDVVNNLTSTNTDKPLSANMGKELNEAIAQSTANIGTVYTGSGSVSSVATGTYTDVLSVSLPAGTYIVIRGCDFGANATGIRRVGSNSGSGRYDFANANAVPNGVDTVVQHIQHITVSSQTEIKCTVYQSSGSSLNIWPYMYAIRIK